MADIIRKGLEQMASQVSEVTNEIPWSQKDIMHILIGNRDDGRSILVRVD
jgi:hypothetical protein